MAPDTILWLDISADRKQPNKQRFKVLHAAEKHIMVQSCGDPTQVVCALPKEMCGIEIHEGYSIFFKQTGHHEHS